MRKADRILFALGAICIAAYFLFMTRQAVRGYFSPDDLMNLYRAWSPPLGLLFKGNILFFLHSPYYRPLGEAWYRIIYFFAGFHPQPFRIVNLSLLLANLFLTYCAARRLADSRAVGAIVTALMSYHGKLAELYFDTGLIFDVLCYFFCIGALAWYLRIRQQNRLLGRIEVAGLCALYICALNSKELAVSLPVFLLAYELMFRGRDKGWFALRRWWPVLITGAITVLFIVGRILAPESLLTQNDVYRPVITWTRFIDTSVVYAANVFYADDWFTPAKLLVLWAGLLAYALAARSRTLQFAWLFLMISPLPLAFLPPRGGPQYYLPLFGWALYAAAMAMDGLDLLLRKLPASLRPWTLRAVTTALVLLIAGSVYAHEKNRGIAGVPAVSEEGPTVRSIRDQLHALYPKLPPQARLFFLHDEVLPAWNLYFLVKLSYHDDTLDVDTDREVKDPQLSAYDHVFDFRRGHLFELTRPWQALPLPAIEMEAGAPQVFHDGFVPVTNEKPALPNEILITRAFDLGETDPHVAPGEPFPRKPLAQVTAKVDARVNGQPAETPALLGWPGEINRYRVDIRLPATTAAGMAKLTLTSGGVTGPAVEIPVKSYADLLRGHKPAPGILVIAGQPQVFHSDWSLVTPAHPARPGEDLITKAIDLGETRPRVPPGMPFPSQAFADIASPVEARVNGRPARTPILIGWPETVGEYRVDLHIPEETTAGAARVTLRVNRVSGPAVEIPVRP